jgi:protein SCO1
MMKIYFGFTRCPDICPEELDKMAEILDSVNGKGKGPVNIQPLFITCDPARDDPKSLQKYLAGKYSPLSPRGRQWRVEYHPDIIGLTGTYDAIKQTCKYFRVYFSTPTDLKPGQDYLVDHSIFFYLMGISTFDVALTG